MVSKALLVGCNYPGSKYELKGCVNDVHNMVAMLKKHFGFEDSNITLLLDTDSSTTKPTGKNIKAALKKFVKGASDDDVLFFHFSGHGVQIKDKTGDEEDSKDEALVATDMNMVSDDDLRGIIKKLPLSVKFTMISDCCHSGGMLDHKEVIIKGDKKLDPEDDEDTHAGNHCNRAIPESDFMSAMADKAGFDIGDSTALQAGMMKVFGNATSKKAKKKLKKKKEKNMLGEMSSIVEEGYKTGDVKGAAVKGMNVAMGGMNLGGGGDDDGHKGGHKGGHKRDAEVEDDDEDDDEDDGEPVPSELGVLITGCQSTETSADVRPGNNPKKACGALSNAIQTVVKAHYSKSDEPMSYRQVVLEARELLAKKGFAQNPCLECDEVNAEKGFITHA